MSRSTRRARNGWSKKLRMNMRAFLKERGLAPIQSNDRTLLRVCAQVLGVGKLPDEKYAARVIIARQLMPELPAPPRPHTKPSSGSRWKETKAVNKEFYFSDEWRTLRYKALRQHGGCCQCCGNRAMPGNPLHVDHIKPRSKYPELELELNNLQVLCADCNLGKRAWDETDWRAA